MQNLETIIQQAQADIATAKNLPDLQQIRAKFLGKKSVLTDLMKTLGNATPDERKALGQLVNAAKDKIMGFADAKTLELQAAELAEQLATEQLDVTLPGRHQHAGALHPVTLVQQRVEAIFKSIGFTVTDGPEVEDQFHNFEALNIPKNHPARAMHDTFYFANGNLLRTHTSTVQIRYMKENKPPIRIISPGRVYRSDSDQTHTPMFNQVEGLSIDEHATFANLKSILQLFMSSFFEQDVQMRLRPSYFPFTEPSAEVDIKLTDPTHPLCGKWLEVLGCGMVHPNVLAAVGIDSEKYTGWAFGCGMDRLAMLRYSIHDLRTTFESDVRFLSQFGV
ncbi:MAG: phenylalanine--tRNA ligase subunit alpha [Gammaproteobacteria bacterium]|nr:phenylalanine--tRNA ligase subunit alpha [Gammaproteobacteria bacterium]